MAQPRLFAPAQAVDHIKNRCCRAKEQMPCVAGQCLAEAQGKFRVLRGRKKIWRHCKQKNMQQISQQKEPDRAKSGGDTVTLKAFSDGLSGTDLCLQLLIRFSKYFPLRVLFWELAQLFFIRTPKLMHTASRFKSRPLILFHSAASSHGHCANRGRNHTSCA